MLPSPDSGLLPSHNPSVPAFPSNLPARPRTRCVEAWHDVVQQDVFQLGQLQQRTQRQLALGAAKVGQQGIKRVVIRGKDLPAGSSSGSRKQRQQATAAAAGQ